MFCVIACDFLSSFQYAQFCLSYHQKERRTLSAKRLDLDACKTKVRKAQSPEKIQQVSMLHKSRSHHTWTMCVL